MDVGIFHQLHCINMLRMYMEDKNAPIVLLPLHLRHCIFYAQRFSLCEADSTLEPGDFLDVTYRRQMTYKRDCADWTTLWKYAKENQLEFERYRDDMVSK